MGAAEFVESYFDAWNRGDAKQVAYHLAANGMYCDVPVQLQRTRDELVTHLKDFFAHDNHQYELIGDILTGTGRPWRQVLAHSPDSLQNRTEVLSVLVNRVHDTLPNDRCALGSRRLLPG